MNKKLAVIFLILTIFFSGCAEDRLGEAFSRLPAEKDLTPKEPVCVASTEVCDRVDNDCDGEIDEENVCNTVELTGDLEVIVVDDFENNKAEYIYYLNDNGKMYELELKDDFLRAANQKVNVKGILKDGKIVVSKIEPLAETDFKKQVSESNVKEENLGPQKTLVVIINVNDSIPEFDKEEVEEFLFHAGYPSFYDYYNKNSYGKISFEGIVMGPYTVESGNIVDIHTKAIELVDNEIYFPDYSRMILLISNNCIICGGRGTIGKLAIGTDDGISRISISWVYENSFRIMVHEMGHNLVLWHANSYTCFDEEGNKTQYSNSCLSNGYGDPYDIMGFNQSGNFSAAHKEEAGWLAEENSITVTEGTYLIRPLEINANPGEIQQIKIPMPFENNYYDSSTNIFYSVEYREAADYDDSPDLDYEGVLIRIVKSDDSDFTYLDTHILDVSLSSVSVPLKVGESYLDHVNGYKITLLNLTLEGATVKIERIPASVNLDFNDPLIDFNFKGQIEERTGYVKIKNIRGTEIREDGLFFDGDSDYITLNGFANKYILQNNEFTISSWVKIDESSLNHWAGTIYEHPWSISEFYIVPNLGYELGAKFKLKFEDNYHSLVSGEPLEKEKWYHVAVTYDNTDYSIYVDGIKKQSKNLEGKKIYASNHKGGWGEAIIGADDTSFLGTLDEFKIYAKGLNEEEILNLYSQGRDPICGDIDQDDIVNPVDVVYIINYVYKNLEDPTACYEPCGDINDDGIVNPVDVVQMINWVYKNLIPECPCGVCDENISVPIAPKTTDPTLEELIEENPQLGEELEKTKITKPISKKN